MVDTFFDWQDFPPGTHVFFWEATGKSTWQGVVDASDTEYYVREAWVTSCLTPGGEVEVRRADGKKREIRIGRLYLSYAEAARDLEQFLLQKLEHIQKSLSRLYFWEENEV